MEALASSLTWPQNLHEVVTQKYQTSFFIGTLAEKKQTVQFPIVYVQLLAL